MKLTSRQVIVTFFVEVGQSTRTIESNGLFARQFVSGHHFYYLQNGRLIHNTMKKILFLLLMSCATLMSCQPDEEEQIDESTQQVSRTIMVFMPFTGNLYDDLNTNINYMAAAITNNGGSNGTQLLVFIAQDRQTAHLIRLRYENGICHRDTLRTYTSPEYLTLKGRAQLFTEMKALAPADEYGLIVGCHGKGWLPGEDSNNTLKWIGADINGYRIDISDFAQSMSDAGLHAQFIAFDDCYMSTIEVAYDLRHVTDHIIASTSEIMASGMPYHRIYTRLIQPTIDYGAICNDFVDYYKSSRTPYGTIGVTCCQYIDEMAAIMKKINTTHTISSEQLQMVQDLDGATFTPTVFFDFGSYVRHLAGSDATLLAAYEQLLTVLVPYKAHTGAIFSGYYQRATKITEFSGIAISDPSSHALSNDSKTHTAWWKATH